MQIPNKILINRNILLTGAAGFIGSNLVLCLMDTAEPLTIVGLDNMNDYDDASLKEYRLQQPGDVPVTYADVTPLER